MIQAATRARRTVVALTSLALVLAASRSARADDGPQANEAPPADAPATSASTSRGAFGVTFGPTVAYGKADSISGLPAATQTAVSVGVHGGIALNL